MSPTRHEARSLPLLPRTALLIAGVTGAALVASAVISRLRVLPSSVEIYSDITDVVSDSHDSVGAIAEWTSELGLLALVLGAIALAWRLRSQREHLARLVLGGGAAIVAYAASEVLKTLLGQPRPCRALSNVSTVAACPPLEDWSLPSNHATIAVAISLVAPAAAAKWAAPLAIAVLASRVVIGVHYPHDVLTEALLAVGVVTTVVALLDPVTRRLLAHSHRP